MSKLTLSIPLLFFIFLQWGYAQQPPLREFLTKADIAYDTGNYKAAFRLYEAVLDYPPKGEDSLRVLYRFAESAHSFNAYEPAEKAYQEAHRVMLLKKQQQNKDYQDVLYHLAEVEQRQGKYEEAALHYEQFQTENPDADARLLALAKKGVINSDEAAKPSGLPLPVEITRLKGSINAPNSDFALIIAGDTTYYSTLRNVYRKDNYKPQREYAQVYISVKGEEGKPLGEDFNEPGEHVSNTAFNRNRSRIYYTVCQYKPDEVIAVRCDIYMRQKQADGKWGLAKKLTINTNSQENTTTQPNVGYDAQRKKEVLYFVSDRATETGDNLHDLNLWYGDINADGDVTTAVPLESLNTSSNEATPFFFETTQMLYFSSDGHSPNLGGYDIYEATRSDNNWSAPSHVRDTISTSYDDLYFSLAAQPDGSLKAHYASNKPGTYVDELMKACCSDIYSTDFRLNLIIHVLDRQTGAPIKDAKVVIGDEANKTQLRTDMTQADGTTPIFAMTYGKSYGISANKTGYISDSIVNTDGLRVVYANTFTVHDTIYLAPPIDLEVYTFRAIDRQPLPNVTVDLYKLEARDTLKVATQSSGANSLALFKNLERGSRYYIKGTNGAYRPDSSTINLGDAKWLNAALARDSLYLSQEVVIRLVDCNTKLPLAGGTLQISFPDGSRKDTTNPTGSDFRFVVDLYQSYPVVASHAGYETVEQTLNFPASVVERSGGRLSAEIPLCPKCLDETEIELFFDNDHPKKPYSPTTLYETTYRRYEGREEVFTQNAIQEKASQDTRDRFKTFFSDMRSEYLKMNRFLQQLAEIAPTLGVNDSIIINLSGQASPRGNEAYNRALSKQRIITVLNQIYAYRGGILRKHIDFTFTDAKNKRPAGARKPIRIYGEPKGEPLGLPAAVPSKERESVGSIFASVLRQVKLEAICNRAGK